MGGARLHPLAGMCNRIMHILACTALADGDVVDRRPILTEISSIMDALSLFVDGPAIIQLERLNWWAYTLIKTE